MHTSKNSILKNIMYVNFYKLKADEGKWTLNSNKNIKNLVLNPKF